MRLCVYTQTDRVHFATLLLDTILMCDTFHSRHAPRQSVRGIDGAFCICCYDSFGRLTITSASSVSGRECFGVICLYVYCICRVLRKEMFSLAIPLPPPQNERLRLVYAFCSWCGGVDAKIPRGIACMISLCLHWNRSGIMRAMLCIALI